MVETVIPDTDLTDSVADENRPAPQREIPEGAIRRIVGSSPTVIPDIPDPQPRSYMGDAARGFASSAVGTAGAAAGFLEYIMGSGGALTKAREGLGATSESLAQGMSPQMQTALGREFTTMPQWLGGDSDKSAWESFGSFLGSASAQAVAMSGSLVSAVPAIIAGAMSGPYAVPAAVVVAAATGGALGGGSVWNDVATEFQKLDESDRMKNPVYAGLRQQGLDPATAIDRTVREVASGYVNAATAVSGAVNAATGPFLGRLGAGTLKGGVLRGAGTGFVTEGSEELIDEGSTQHFSASAIERLTGKPYDFKEVAEGAVRGLIGGGVTGAGMGALGGMLSREPPAPGAVDPAILAATQNQTPSTGTASQPSAPVDPAVAAAMAAKNATTPPAGGMPGTPGSTPGSEEPVPPGYGPAPRPIIAMGPTSFEPDLLSGQMGPRSAGTDAMGQNILPLEGIGVPQPGAPAAAPSFMDFVMGTVADPRQEAMPFGAAIPGTPRPQTVAPGQESAALPGELPGQGGGPNTAQPAPAAPVAPVTETPAVKPKRAKKVKAAAPAPAGSTAVVPTSTPPESVSGAITTAEPVLEGEVIPPEENHSKLKAGGKKRLADAVKQARDSLRASTKLASEKIFGPETEQASDATVSALVDEILADAQREIGDPSTKSVRELMTLILERSTSRLRTTLEERAAATTNAETEFEGAQDTTARRVSNKNIMDAAAGDRDATEKVREHIKRIDKKRLPEFYKRVSKALASTDTVNLDWFNELKAAVEGASRGGSAEQRAKRAEVVEATRENLAQQAEADKARFAEQRAAVMAGVGASTPSYTGTKTKEQIVERFREAQRALARALGVEPTQVPAKATKEAREQFDQRQAKRLRTLMLQKIGASKDDDSDAAQLVEFFSDAAELDANAPREMLQNYQSSEALARAGDVKSARSLLAETAAIENSSTGTALAPGEEGITEERDPEALNQTRIDDVNLSGADLGRLAATARERAALADTRQERDTGRLLGGEDRGQTREVEDTAEASEDDIAAYIQARKAAAAMRPKGTTNKLEAEAPTVTRRGMLRGIGAAVLSWAMGDKVFAQTVPAAERARAGDFAGALDAIAKHSSDPALRAVAGRLSKLMDGIPLYIIEYGKDYAGTDKRNFPAALNHALGVTRIEKNGGVTVWLRFDPKGQKAHGVNDYTIVHEALHAALMSRWGEFHGNLSLNGTVVGSLKGKPGVEHIQTLANLYKAYQSYVFRDAKVRAEVKAHISLDSPYKDFDEFIAYAVSNKVFQDWMKRQSLNQPSMWQRFVNAIAGLFGFKGDQRTMLETALDATNALLDVAASVPVQNTSPRATPTDFAPGRFDKKEESDGVVEKLEATTSAFSRLVRDAIPVSASESFLANIGGGLKKVGLGFSTNRQIEFWLDKHFPRTEFMDWVAPDAKGDLMHVAVVANNQRRQIAENRMEKFIPAVRQLVSLGAQAEREVSELLVDASMAQVHPDAPLDAKGRNKHAMGAGQKKAQMRERHAALKARYDRLSKEQRAAYHEVLKAAAEGHRDAVHSIIANVVNRWWLEQVNNFQRDPDKNPLPGGVKTPAEAAKMVAAMRENALADKMTDEQKEMMGDDWFGQIVKAHHRAKLDGPYVPFQRQGDFVVSWKEPAEEYVTFGTEAEAERFAQSTPYDVMGTEQKHYDKDGNEILEPDLGIMLDLQGEAKDALGERADPKDLQRAMRKAEREALKKTRERDTAKTEWVVRQQVNGMAMFETEAEANRAARELRESGRKVSDVDLRKTAAQRRSDLQDADFAKIIDSIQSDKNLSDEQKNNAIDSLQEAMLMTLPNRALNSTLIRRRNVLGPSREVRRVMSNYGLAVANFTAGIDTGLTITSALSEMNRITNEGRRDDSADDGTTLARRRGLREMEMRLLEPPLDNPGTAGRWVRRVQTAAFIHFLASPSYTAIQMTQPWMLTMPILAARYGAMAGPSALAKATRDIGLGAILKAGVKDTGTALRTFITGAAGEQQPILEQVRNRLAKLPDGAGLTKMLDSLAAEGLVDGDAGLELMRAEVTADSAGWRKLGQLEALTRAMPAAVEVVNRTSSAVAAYRLEMKKSGDHDKAVLAAREVVDQSQADYSSSNTARYMDSRRYPWIAPMMTFRKYAQAVYALLARQVYQSFKGATKEERRQAMKTLAYVMGAHVAVAGTLGLPTEAITVVLGTVALAMGADEPWDWEKEVRQGLAEAFGKEAGEVLARGLPRLAGVDLHSRMGLNALLFVNDLRDYEKRSTMEYAGSLVFGAPGSMLTAWLGAPAQLANGDLGRAGEALVPKGARDVMKAMRFSEEGVTTKKGERIDEGREFSVGDAIIQGLGFTPAWTAEVYERRQAVQGANRRLTTERSEMIRNWRQAKPEQRAEQWQRVMEWNQKLPAELRSERITRANLIASEQEAKRRAKASGGADYLPKGREALRKEGDFANVR
jgi:hypothetical protein